MGQAKTPKENGTYPTRVGVLAAYEIPKMNLDEVVAEAKKMGREGEEMTTLKERASFNAGWDAAIQEVSDAVAGYIASQKSGDNPDPWEEWLPRFLRIKHEA